MKLNSSVGLFQIGLKIVNHADPARVCVVPRVLVDTGSEYTWIRAETTDEAVSGQPGDLQLLGARALAERGLRADSRRKRRAAAGPVIAAAAPPWFGSLVQVSSKPRRRQAAAKTTSSR